MQLLVGDFLCDFRAGKDKWNVFYHFVGAVPGSTELLLMLRRLLKEMEVHKDVSPNPEL